jgi:hypothetical protein
VEFVYKPPSSELQTEYGSSQPVRFLQESFNINLKNEPEGCQKCDAHQLLFELKDIDLNNPDQNIIESVKSIKEAVEFILENVNWPDKNLDER